jgi:hypothetical protein
MKSKKTIYILLPATIAIWVTIFVRIVNTLGSESASKIVKAESKKIIKPESEQNQTFLINNNYRDPFQIKSSYSQPTSSSDQQKLTKKNTIPHSKTTAQWPQIIYSGMIKNQKSKKQLALLQINSETKTAQTGETIDKIKIGKIQKDSIEIILGKEKRYIKK